MGLLVNGTEREERVHEFRIQTPQGMAQVKVPHSQMKKCVCGCDRFQTQYHVAIVKPNGLLNAPPMTLRVELYACVECGTIME